MTEAEDRASLSRMAALRVEVGRLCGRPPRSIVVQWATGASGDTSPLLTSVTQSLAKKYGIRDLDFDKIVEGDFTLRELLIADLDDRLQLLARELDWET